MKQKTVKTILGFIEASDQAISGATSHPGLVSINTAAAISADQVAMLAKRDEYKTARNGLKNNRAALQQKAKLTRAKLIIARDVLRTHLGQGYNQTWDTTGLVGSLKIPSRPQTIQSLLPMMHAHFANNPTHENEGLNVTADYFDIARNEMSALQTAVNNGQVQVKTLLTQRNEKVAAVDKRLKDLFGELKMKLTPLDPRWVDFGFKPPGQVERPPKPTKVSLALAGADSLSVKWIAVPRATYYRVWVKVNGKDEVFLPIASPGDLDFTIQGLPSATVVEVGITAVNSGGESEMSPIASFTTL